MRVFLVKQGRIYIENEYPTLVRNILIFSRKLSITLQITLNLEDKAFRFDEQQANFRVEHTNSSVFKHLTVGVSSWAPYK